MTVDEYGALSKWTDVNDLLVDGFNMALETNGGDSSWLDRKN